MDQEEKTFTDFSREFAAKHAIPGRAGGTVTLDITQEELVELGRAFIGIMVDWVAGKEELIELGRAFVGIMVGWGAGLEASRARRRGMAPPEWFTPGAANEDERPRLTLVRQSNTVE